MWRFLSQRGEPLSQHRRIFGARTLHYWERADAPECEGLPFAQREPRVDENYRLTERVNLEFRAEFFNVFNRHTIGAPAANLSNPFSFGTVSSIGGARTGQLAMKITF